jgi:hypothetical protein
MLVSCHTSSVCSPIRVIPSVHSPRAAHNLQQLGGRIVLQNSKDLRAELLQGRAALSGPRNLLAFDPGMFWAAGGAMEEGENA